MKLRIALDLTAIEETGEDDDDLDDLDEDDNDDNDLDDNGEDDDLSLDLTATNNFTRGKNKI